MTEPKHSETKNLRVTGYAPLASPRELVEQLPVSERAAKTVIDGRAEIREALAGNDDRLLVITGPCSIHDRAACKEYAHKLVELRREVGDQLLIVMRVYFEKPRTTVGWKGLISDPRLDGSNDMTGGLTLAREILCEINDLGLPCATEFLDPIVPQYIADLVSWVAIGARTTESQTHRQLASGLSMPVGFKNSTDGSLQVGIDAVVSARHPHAFLGIDMEGQTCIVQTSGNADAHLVLRGGGGQPNFSRAHIAFAKALLEKVEHPRALVVDCSHGNSDKDYRRQPEVFDAVLDQALGGERTILGAMLESNLVAGNQKYGGDLVYGKSLTDGCIDWETTESLLRAAHAKLGSERRKLSA
jgi:3-deoxy-7-phosphoheptulonate synthase